MKVRRLHVCALFIGVCVFATSTLASALTLQAARSQTARCEWNFDGDFCEDLACSVIEGHCEGNSPAECLCVVGK